VSIIGTPAEWSDLIDPMVPMILGLVITSWQEMPSPAGDEKEDNITEGLCRILKQNRTARDLPFQIHIQFVELEPANNERLGRLDITFIPPINREDIYFCLECKRLNVVSGGTTRSYASEYVLFGMLRFVTGQYAKAVRHGGMLGYVLDGNVSHAMTNVEANIQSRGSALGMSLSGTFMPSTVLENEECARETHHVRSLEKQHIFRIHHLFMAA
jgi:hypothetical protein